MLILCTICDLMLNEKALKYNFNFIASKYNACKLEFFPEKPLWNEHKLCPERTVDDIINYIKNLNVYHYDDIPLKEE